MGARELYDTFIASGRKWQSRYCGNLKGMESCRIGLYILKKKLKENYSIRQNRKAGFEVTIFDKL